MASPELALQKSVVTFLDYALPSGAVYFAIPNGGRRDARTGAMLKAMGVKAGAPDLCVLHRGRAVFIELKATPGRASQAQLDMAARLGAAGAGVYFCTTIRQVEAALRAEGVILRAAA